MKDNEFKKDLEFLMNYSGYASKYVRYSTMTIEGEEYEIIDASIGSIIYDKPKYLLDVFGWYEEGPTGADTFHPKNAGCIVLSDDYLFGIRCDHLIWIDYEDWEDNAPKTLLIGNHKGIAVFRTITYNKKLSEK